MGTQHESHRPFDPSEDDFVRDTLGEPAGVVAEVLGRNVSSVLNRRMILTDPEAYEAFKRYVRDRNQESLKGADHYRQTWTVEEDSFVLDTLDDPLVDVAEVLGRTISSVATRRLQLRRGLVNLTADREIRSVSGASTAASAGPLCPKCWLYHRGDCP